MDPFFAMGVLILILIMTVIGPISYVYLKSDFRFQFLKKVAKKFPGMSVSSFGLFFRGYRITTEQWESRLQWVAGSENFMLRSAVPSRLQVEFRFNRKVPTFGLRPKGRAGMYIKIWGGKTCPTGDEEMDRRFAFKSVDDGFASRFLHSKLPGFIRHLASFRKGTEFGVSMGGNSGRITLLKPTYNLKRMAKFLWASFRLVDHLVALPVQEEPAVDPGSAGLICPICGQNLVEDCVKCRKCGRGHHLSCWKYAGNCSDWDCGGKRYH